MIFSEQKNREHEIKSRILHQETTQKIANPCKSRIYRDFYFGRNAEKGIEKRVTCGLFGVLMERTTFGLLFYIRRDKTNKKGEAPVFMRLTINGERADASIKRFIEPHAWNSAKGKANEKSRGGKDLNLYLDAISANILRIQRDLELDKKEVSAQIILNRYLGKAQSDRHTLMEVFRAHNEKCRALSGISLAPGTGSATKPRCG